MNVRCPYCNQNFHLRREFVAEALAEMEEEDLKYCAPPEEEASEQ